MATPTHQVSPEEQQQLKLFSDLVPGILEFGGKNHRVGCNGKRIPAGVLEWNSTSFLEAFWAKAVAYNASVVVVGGSATTSS
jgi:hypothetical protein